MLKWLDALIRDVCPIDGLSWQGEQIHIQFRKDATPEQMRSAERVRDQFDWNDVAGFAQWRQHRALKRRLTDKQITDLTNLQSALQAGTALTNAQLTKGLLIAFQLLLT